MAARDTTPGAREAQLAAWRRLGGPGRVELAWQMSESAREVSIAGILARSPALSREKGSTSCTVISVGVRINGGAKGK